MICGKEEIPVGPTTGWMYPKPVVNNGINYLPPSTGGSFFLKFNLYLVRHNLEGRLSWTSHDQVHVLKENSKVHSQSECQPWVI